MNTTAPVADNGTEQLHLWWGLSYAQYLTVPRSVMQSMPDKWQAKMAALLNELDSTIDWRPKGDSCYQVRLMEVVYRGDKEKWGKKLEDSLEDYQRGRRRIGHDGGDRANDSYE